MEKSTLSALIIAGGAVAAGVAQALVLRAAKRKRLEREAAARKEPERPDSGSTASDESA
jgi:hypothetical protein